MQFERGYGDVTDLEELMSSSLRTAKSTAAPHSRIVNTNSYFIQCIISPKYGVSIFSKILILLSSNVRVNLFYEMNNAVEIQG